MSNRDKWARAYSDGPFEQYDVPAVVGKKTLSMGTKKSQPVQTREDRRSWKRRRKVRYRQSS